MRGCSLAQGGARRHAQHTMHPWIMHQPPSLPPSPPPPKSRHRLAPVRAVGAAGAARNLPRSAPPGCGRHALWRPGPALGRPVCAGTYVCVFTCMRCTAKAWPSHGLRRPGMGAAPASLPWARRLSCACVPLPVAAAISQHAVRLPICCTGVRLALRVAFQVAEAAAFLPSTPPHPTPRSGPPTTRCWRKTRRARQPLAPPRCTQP